jgi:uncharacterized protein (DUF58 family)
MRPTRVAVAVCAAFVVAALLPGPPQVRLLAAALAAALLALDLALVLLARVPAASREAAPVLAIGARVSIGLLVHSRSRGPQRLLVHDHAPPCLRAEGLPLRVVLPAGQDARLAYTVVPVSRGAAAFGRVDVLIASPLGLWRRRVLCGEPQDVRIYPDFASLVRYTLLAAENRIDRLGIHKRRRRGTGLEFHQLREYRPGDPPSQIDWKATSKRLALIAREYQDEQGQQLMLLLDCGRRMRAREGLPAALAHFDHALNAVLLLSHVALRQGDSVGLATFGGTDRGLAPRRGASAINRLLEATYDIQPTVYASDLVQALEDAAARLRKRSLIVLVSNLGGGVPGLAEVGRVVARRHLVLFAALREAALDELAGEEPGDLASALRVTAAHRLLGQRRSEINLLRAAGLLCVDVLPAELPAALASAYFAIKASNTL